MIRIAITQAAFEAIAVTLPPGSVGYANGVNERGERVIWLEPRMFQRDMIVVTTAKPVYDTPLIRRGEWSWPWK